MRFRRITGQRDQPTGFSELRNRQSQHRSMGSSKFRKRRCSTSRVNSVNWRTRRTDSVDLRTRTKERIQASGGCQPPDSSHGVPISRGPLAVLAMSTIISSWLLMQIIHESGHVLGAILTGGEIRRVVLVPWDLSRTDLIHNPRPLIVCWAGPVIGAIAPVGIWLVMREVDAGPSVSGCGF